MVTTYGMTETCGGCVYDGVPLDGVDVQPGPDGRIRIAGPVLFSGYRLRPDLTAAAFDGRWFVTSDLGLLGPDGRLVVRGRADDVITTGGEKVVPAEVAALVEAHPAVREAVVFGMPDRDWGERVTAVVVAADPARPPALADLRAHVRRAAARLRRADGRSSSPRTSPCCHRERQTSPRYAPGYGNNRAAAALVHSACPWETGPSTYLEEYLETGRAFPPARLLLSRSVLPAG